MDPLPNLPPPLHSGLPKIMGDARAQKDLCGVRQEIGIAATHKEDQMIETTIELEIIDADEGQPPLLLMVSAEGDTPFDFFGGAIVQGWTERNDMWRDWWVAKTGCPMRDEAIEILMEEWAKVNGAITRLEVEAIFKLAQPEKVVDFKTYGDKEGK